MNKAIHFVKQIKGVILFAFLYPIDRDLIDLISSIYWWWQLWSLDFSMQKLLSLFFLVIKKYFSRDILWLYKYSIHIPIPLVLTFTFLSCLNYLLWWWITNVGFSDFHHFLNYISWHSTARKFFLPLDCSCIYISLNLWISIINNSLPL